MVKILRLGIAAIQSAALVVILVAAYYALDHAAFTALAAAVVLAVSIYVEARLPENGDAGAASENS